MASDVAEFLWNKFLSSLQEADTELLGSTFISYFTAIKNVVKEIDVVPKPDSYGYSISMLYDLNDALVECLIFMRECKKRDKKLLLFNPFTHYFTQKMKKRLKAIKRDLESSAVVIKRELENPAAAREETGNPLDMMRAEGPILSSKVFGFHEYAEKIEGLLYKGGGGFMGIGVVGISGIGKTTLVQMVLQSQKLEVEFNPIIWLPFSGPDTKEEEEGQPSRVSFEACILDNLGNIIDKKIVGLDKLLERLNQYLSGKRYLIVLDDVCHRHKNIMERLWLGLSKRRGGTVIVTSRVPKVVQKLVGQNNMVVVEPLGRETCWSIFQETVKNAKEFSSISHGGETLGRIEEEIKDQCYGLPLAAKLLAQIIPKQICQMTL